VNLLRIELVGILLIGLTAFGLCAETGTLTGTVTEEKTKMDLSGVSVEIMDSHLGAATDDRGHFYITGIEPGVYQLQFSAIGYTTLARDSILINPGHTTSLSIQLEAQVLKLDEITVTATRQAQLLARTCDVTIIQTAEDIRTIGAAHVDDIIEYMPGVSSVAGTGSGQPFKRAVSINGLPATYGLILLDGRRVLSSHIHTGANVNIIPPEHIERIELVKGAMSAQYGTDGIGGVLNIITRKGSDKTRVTFSSYAGSQKTFHNGISITGSVATGIKHSFFSSWEQSDGLPIIKPVFRKGKLSYTMFHLMDNVEAKISDRLNMSASIFYINTESPYQQNPSASTLLTPSLEFEYEISKNLKCWGSGYYSKWSSQRNNELNETASPELVFNYLGWDSHNLLLGGEYIFNNFRRVRVTENNQENFGFFMQDEFIITSAWRLLTAIRLDKVENIAPVVTPKVSVLIRALNNLSLRASFGRGFRAPTLQDLNETLYSHPGNIHFRAGNPDLKPEYSTNIMAGMDWNIADNISFIVNAYHYSIENMITPIDHGLEDPTLYFPSEQIPFITDTLAYIYQRENIHKGLINGGEIKMLWDLSSEYSIESGLSLTDNKNEDTGKSLPYYPGKSVSLKIKGKQALARGTTLGGFVGLNAAMDRKIWRFIHDSEQEVKLNNYQKLDAGLSLSLQNGYELFFNVDNLLEQEIHLYEDVEMLIEGTRLFRGGIRLHLN